jgi:UDP-glucose:(heptosyl)LPS alpha-1,3-glucosyltransferase
MVLRNPLHGFLLAREEIRHGLGLYRRVVCLSQSEAQRLRSHYRIRRPIEVIPNGVDTERFSPAIDRVGVRRHLDLKESHRYLLFVGHEFERKGLKHAVDALGQLPQECVLLVVGGSPGDADRWSQFTETAGVSDRVLFFGPRSDVELFFQAADVFVLPSAFESFALVALEAMAAGLPTVISPGAAAGDYLEDGTNGFLASTGSEIAEVVERVLSDSELRKSVTQAARETALLFSWESVAKRYVDVIHSIRRERSAL